MILAGGPMVGIDLHQTGRRIYRRGVEQSGRIVDALVRFERAIAILINAICPLIGLVAILGIENRAIVGQGHTRRVVNCLLVAV
jgi:hypothetical protein